MKELTFDQCKNLKSWGFPQKPSYKFWGKKGRFETLYIGGTKASLYYIAGLDESYTCPDLETLLDWLNNEWRTISLVGDTDDWCADIEENHGDDYQPEAWHGEGKTPLLAVYALAESLYGKKQ